MRVKPDFDIDKWCVYNQSTFELELKKDVPQGIKEKFKKWKEAYDEPFEKMIEDLKTN